MKRTAVLPRRTAIRRGRVRIGAAARRRVRDGGPIATGRPALSRAGYEALRALIADGRAGWRCEACATLYDVTGALEHAVPRSQGGNDSWENCWLPCAPCGDMTQAPYEQGRLLRTPLGDGTFRFQRVRGTKYDYVVELDTIGGRPATDEERQQLEALR